jgi:hypothetical protein
LSDRLSGYCSSANGGATPLGAVAVEAIRTHWRSIGEAVAVGGIDDIFPAERVIAGRLNSVGGSIRRIFYVSLEEAQAVEEVRRRLGGIEIGQLHRLALDRHLAAD